MRANMPMEHGQNGAAGCDSEDQNVLRKTLKKKAKNVSYVCTGLPLIKQNSWKVRVLLL